MSVGAWGKARGSRSLQRGTEQNDQNSQSHPVTTHKVPLHHATPLIVAFKVRIPRIPISYNMADYKPVQGVSDDAVELVGEQPRSEDALIESQKIGIQEPDNANVPHRESGTPGSSIINLANTVLGTGMLAMVRHYLACYLIMFAIEMEYWKDNASSDS
jgi:hypothetical protein